MKFNQDNFFSEIPSGWIQDRFKDVVQLRCERTSEANPLEDYLELEDIESGTGRILNYRSTTDVVSDVTIFKKGDVLFGKLRPYLEKYCVAEFDGKCTGEILAFKPERIRSKFLFYCLASTWFIERCNMLAYGTKMPRVNWQTQLAQFKFPLPSISEQDIIAAYLDASCAAIDSAVEVKRRQIEKLDALLVSMIRHAVTGGLDIDAGTRKTGLDWLPDAPAHWEVQQIKRRCKLLRGRFSHRPRNDPALYDGEYPFVQTGEITSAWKYIRGYSQTLNEHGFSVSKMFPKGTLVMSIAANVGDVAILDFDACFPDSMIGLIPDHRTNLDFLYYLMRAMKDVLLRSAILTTQLNLNYVRIGTNFAAFPPKREQEKIASYLDAKSDEIRSIQSILHRQIFVLTAYRKSLIHECVTGRRRVTEEDVARARGNGAERRFRQAS